MASKERKGGSDVFGEIATKEKIVRVIPEIGKNNLYSMIYQNWLA